MVIDKVKSNAKKLSEYHKHHKLIKLILFPYVYYISKKQLKLFESQELKDYIFSICKKEDGNYIKLQGIYRVGFNHGFYLDSYDHGTWGLPDADERLGYDDCFNFPYNLKECLKSWACAIILVIYLYFAFIGLYTTFLRM